MQTLRYLKKLSGIISNSDLLVTIQLFDGPSKTPVTIPLQTPYHAFTNNKRNWDQYLQLPINYNQVTYDSFLKIVLWEIVDTKMVQFGVGYVSVYNSDATLRNGTQKVEGISSCSF